MRFDKILKPTQFKVRSVQFLCHLILFFFLWHVSLYQFMLGVFFAYICNIFGSACGAHRLWSHQSYQTNYLYQWIMALLFTVTTCGSVIGYVLLHERHHKYADTEKDPHSPLHNGILKTWFGFYSDSAKQINVLLYKRLMQDRVLAVTHDYYFLIIGFFAIGLSWMGFSYVLCFYCIPVVFQFHINSLVTVFCHWPMKNKQSECFGPQYRNLSPFFMLLLFGEELHKNHHLRPDRSDYNYDKKVLQFDVIGAVLSVISSKRLAKRSK
jgi:stearoyl-CoA desaturase (Delta-9 desaturase)